MAFENIALFNHIAECALAKYPFGDECQAKLLVLSENATYMVESKLNGDKRGVLRICRPGYHTIEEINSEMLWLRQINEYTPLIVANPISGTDGNSVQAVTVDNREYYCVMCEYLTGQPPKAEDEAAMIKQFEYLGETTAYLHRQTIIWNGTKKLHRIEWNYDTIVGKDAVFGDWRMYPGLTEKELTLFNRCTQIIERRLGRYKKTENNYGLIHADLRLANLLIDGDEIKVIDFDDCGFGYHLHDLASALSFIEEKPIVVPLVNAWLKGYKRILPFTDTDFEEIDTFILMRRLSMMGWLASHTESDPVKELSVGYLEGSVYLAERYVRMFG